MPASGGRTSSKQPRRKAAPPSYAPRPARPSCSIQTMCADAQTLSAAPPAPRARSIDERGQGMQQEPIRAPCDRQATNPLAIARIAAPAATVAPAASSSRRSSALSTDSTLKQRRRRPSRMGRSDLVCEARRNARDLPVHTGHAGTHLRSLRPRPAARGTEARAPPAQAPCPKTQDTNGTQGFQSGRSSRRTARKRSSVSQPRANAGPASGAAHQRNHSVALSTSRSEMPNRASITRSQRSPCQQQAGDLAQPLRLPPDRILRATAVEDRPGST